MKRILIDLTDLELWRGDHGGTQRVVYGIAKHYFLKQASLEQKVVFIAFSSGDKAFHVTNFEPIHQRVLAMQAAREGGAVHHATSGLKHRIKRYIQSYTPDRLQKSKSARRTAQQAFKISARVYRKTRSFTANYRQQTKRSHAARISFRADDTVLVLGKPWDNLDIQKTLTAARDQAHCKVVQLVYDLIICLQPQLHHPSLFTSYTQHMFEAVSNSDAMLAISESSKRDLGTFCERLKLTQPPTEVIRLGDELETTAVSSEKPDIRIQKDFIACVGTVEIRKNHILLYYTYKLALEQGIKLPQLVILGGRGWLTADFQYLVKHDTAMRDQIIILHDINDAGLDWVYKNCLFTVYPSMYEGWGLPVAESLAYGRLCIAADDSSIPEIAGDLIAYFSPYSTQACLDSMVKYLDPTVRKQKEALITQAYQTTSWEQTFKQCQSLVSRISKAA